jgi:hypothetical protein
MIWWFASSDHEFAISGWVRNWLRSSFADRSLQVLFLSVPWWMGWAVLSALAKNAVPFLLAGSIPVSLLLLDAIIDHYYTNGKIDGLMRLGDVVLATRAEYVGGHPELPHGRFAYLTIEGTRENPRLTIIFPNPDGDDAFDIPLLDLDKTKQTSEKAESLAGSLLASLTDRPSRFLSNDRVTLNVDYQGSGGRKHKVELTSFFRGADEIRNWRNYLICAQAEADTGVKPYGPWKSLKRERKRKEPSHDGTGNGGKVPPARRAFERR